jgi:hypothetical protein
MAGQRIELPQYSMFAKTPIYDLGGDTVVFGLMQPAVVPDDTDELWVVPPAGVPRLDLLANDFYGTPQLWWVLSSVNNMLDPLVSVPTGTAIRVPTKERLSAEGILNV